MSWNRVCGEVWRSLLAVTSSHQKRSRGVTFFGSARLRTCALLPVIRFASPSGFFGPCVLVALLGVRSALQIFRYCAVGFCRSLFSSVKERTEMFVLSLLLAFTQCWDCLRNAIFSVDADVCPNFIPGAAP